MENFPSNSRRIPLGAPNPEPAPEKKFDAPLFDASHVTQRKKGVGQRMRETFFPSDAGSIVRYLVEDVVVPNLKDFLFDFFNHGLQQTLYGEVRNAARRPTGYGTSSGTGTMSTPYHSRFNANPNRPQPRSTTREPDYVEDNVIVLKTKVEVQELLEVLEGTLDEYGSFSVADINDILGLTDPYTNRRWGWKSMQGFSYAADRNGWRLVTPPPIDLKK